MGKVFKASVSIVVLTACAGALFLFFIFFTPAGAEFIFKQAAVFYLPSLSLETEAQGDLASGMTFTDVEFLNLKGFPSPNTLRVQNFYVKLDGFGADRITAHVENARLMLPDSDPIVFSLHFQDGVVKGNVHTRMLVSDDLSWLPELLPSRLQVKLRRVDIDFEGPFDELVLRGSFDVDRVQRDDFVLRDSECRFDLTVKDIDPRRTALRGEVVFRNGVLSGRRTAQAFLRHGELRFEGDPLNPRLNIRGDSRVERVRMDIIVTGYLDDPDLYLSSDAGLSQDRLLMMLATNQSWGGAERVLTEQNLSPGVAKDFLDYFLSGYANGGRASWFVDWIRAVSVDYDSETGHIGIRAGITDRFEAGYQVQQQRALDQAGIYKLTGEYQLTDHFSILGEKEIRDRVSESGDAFYYSTIPDDRVLFRIRKKF